MANACVISAVSANTAGFQSRETSRCAKFGHGPALIGLALCDSIHQCQRGNAIEHPAALRPKPRPDELIFRRRNRQQPLRFFLQIEIDPMRQRIVARQSAHPVEIGIKQNQPGMGGM